MKGLKSPININTTQIKQMNELENRILRPPLIEEETKEMSEQKQKEKLYENVIVDIDFDKLVVQDKDMIYYNSRGERINTALYNS